ncbi:AAA family ATPase [Paracoccus sp. AK26]|uniref:AAA family ATPase n=1 Tax=Paracoccus sp. AK26 TaxID=2589076 RepID=UPI0014301EBE|nr:AAA family ATPase [Paracoccus sp. AK26]
MTYPNIAATRCQSFMGRVLVQASSYVPNLDRPYLVKGLLLAGQVSLLVGPPNTGKSSVIACLAAHMSMGHAISGIPVRRTAILYIAAEDPQGIAERAYGYLRSPVANISEFFIHGEGINLTDDAEMAACRAEAVRLFSGTDAPRRLIVIDTLNLCIGDGDENSSRDMSRVVGHAQRLAHETGAHVMIIHHTGASDAGRPRGSTAMQGNADTILVLRKADGQEGGQLVLLTQEKQRSMAKGKPLAFEIGSYEIGQDEDGDTVTVPIARPAMLSSSQLARATESRKLKGESQSREAEVLRVLRALHAADGGKYHEARDVGARVGEAFESVRNNADSLRKAVRRALDSLVSEKEVEHSGSNTFRAVPLDAATNNDAQLPLG